MIRSTVKTFDFFPQLNAAIEQRTIHALETAAEAGRKAAEQQAAGLGDLGVFTTIPIQKTADGYRSGIRGRNGKWRIFDKGSLGKRVAALKRPGSRKTSWDVARGDNPYEATRGDVTGEGVAARNISNPARTAGRKALIRGITGR